MVVQCFKKRKCRKVLMGIFLEKNCFFQNCRQSEERRLQFCVLNVPPSFVSPRDYLSPPRDYASSSRKNKQKVNTYNQLLVHSSKILMVDKLR
jgi:hypothetical protein